MWKPLYDRILVRVVEKENLTTGGIYIPDNAREKPQLGLVVETGIGRIDKEGNICPLFVKKDNFILFGKYSGQEIEIDGNKFLIMREDEILAVRE